MTTIKKAALMSLTVMGLIAASVSASAVSAQVVVPTASPSSSPKAMDLCARVTEAVRKVEDNYKTKDVTTMPEDMQAFYASLADLKPYLDNVQVAVCSGDKEAMKAAVQELRDQIQKYKDEAKQLKNKYKPTPSASGSATPSTSYWPTPSTRPSNSPKASYKPMPSKSPMVDPVETTAPSDKPDAPTTDQNYSQTPWVQGNGYTWKTWSTSSQR
jgi:hypothetical protein